MNSPRPYGTVEDRTDFGGRIIKFSYDGNFDDIIDAIGEMPLPPYIHEKMEDPNQYQTVYANERGSAAAPTAGLHFTEELLQKIRDKGVEEVFVTLHVGLGTFRPVERRKHRRPRNAQRILQHYRRSGSDDQ